MIASPNYESRNGAVVRLIVLHTAEGALDTASLGRFFANPASQVSSHVGIDDRGIETYVDPSQSAWTLRNGNPISENAEMCGFAAWTRQQWLDQHMPMLRNAAAWVRERCQARGIPVVKLSPADVAAGKAGVIGHYDWTIGMRDGSHTDPGPGFPWDVLINLAAAGTTPPGDDVAWTDQLPDLYPGAPKRTIDAGTQLAFANAHAAQALDEARAARASADAALAEVRALRKALGK